MYTCKLLCHLLKVSGEYSLHLIKSNLAQPSAYLRSLPSLTLLILSPKGVFQPTIAIVVAIVAIAPWCITGIRVYHLSSTVVPSKAESHLLSCCQSHDCPFGAGQVHQWFDFLRGESSAQVHEATVLIKVKSLSSTQAGCQPRLWGIAFQGLRSLSSPPLTHNLLALTMWQQSPFSLKHVASIPLLLKLSSLIAPENFSLEGWDWGRGDPHGTWDLSSS